MTIEIRVPKMGMDTTEVTVSKWFVEVGDLVKIGTPLVELESEKVTFVLDSEVEGQVITISQTVGSIVPVGELLGVTNTKVD